ncbi:MAG: YARHG domain-containing protein [Clostridiales bacterium]|nr:YARHG domain-containing protein [Clostridiales bacterium]
MKKVLAALMASLMMLLIAATAVADMMYILPESNTRRLTWDEVAEWDYETLGYAFNELMARHGFNFEPGQRYDNYFSTLPWYTPNANPDKQIVYHALSEIEWDNYRLIKAVREEKRVFDYGKSMWDNYSRGFATLQGFEYAQLKTNQILSVYSAPDYRSWRGSNGKAQVSTNGAIYAAGWESGWLLVMYEINNGSVRVGYVDSQQIKGTIPVYETLNFSYEQTTVTQDCVLTDDPARYNASIVRLSAGDTVTYLTTYFNNKAWDYVEVQIRGQVARGFIQSGNLALTAEDPLDTLDTDPWSK